MMDMDIDMTVVQMQQVLERDFPQREWRVLVSQTPPGGESDDFWIFVHARTRDFRYRCRVGRPWRTVVAAPTLNLLVAEIAAEAEQRLTEQAAVIP